MQQIYRRWLSRYRWANVLRTWFLQIYFRYWTIKLVAEIPYSLIENIERLAEMRSEHAASSDYLLIKNATVIGFSRFILKDRLVAYDASYPGSKIGDVHTDYLFQEETHQLIFFEPEGQFLFPELTIHSRLDGAWLSIMSASTNNWMHWLSESIPRLAVALGSMKDSNFGLLVDQQLPDNMRDVLDIFAAELPRFKVPPHHAVEVSKLIVPLGPNGICAFWARPPSVGNGVFHFDAIGLRLARDTILKHFDCQPRKSRKLFILRKSFFRHITNQGRIEVLLRSHGFESISPGEMSVEEQVKVFSEAAVVVAQAGAALANIMFMPEESAVICLSVCNEHVNYDYFRDYAKIFGVAMEYVLGTNADPSRYDATHTGQVTHPMNAEFSCPEKELVVLLEKTLYKL